MTEHDGEFEKWYSQFGDGTAAGHTLKIKDIARVGFQAGRAAERASFAERCVAELNKLQGILAEEVIVRNDAITIITRLAQTEGVRSPLNPKVPHSHPNSKQLYICQ